MHLKGNTVGHWRCFEVVAALVPTMVIYCVNMVYTITPAVIPAFGHMVYYKDS